MKLQMIEAGSFLPSKLLPSPLAANRCPSQVTLIPPASSEQH